ncbi:protocatechuate 3,4-dioxygenase subunit beta [Glutamicibacter arilaitensis]|uniref:Protocatechuate 3,4-dioxygenase subunit beta n=1 Tax=Glutamicibacter arilaitensis TaxID=256701 RepID=A0A4Y8TTB9_9MICC|nr:protocatechuate 3,4-dioxygenase subunit beta [Glutamicibacter arilaitensis]
MSTGTTPQDGTEAESFANSHLLDPAATTASQDEISGEIASIHEAYRQEVLAGNRAETQPRIDFAPYRSSLLRHPTKNLHHADPETIELHSPAFGQRDVHALESDLTIQHNGEPIGERIVVAGRVLDGDGRPVVGQLVEIWQANAAGRYIHKRDQHPAPIDPNFTGVGRAITGPNGEYSFTTIKPAPYPWKNHHNAWRPAHIHFSLFGTDFTQRMITQMYFPGDPLFALDPIYQSITDAKARERLVATYDHSLTSHEWATGYNWDIVLTGSNRTWMEDEEGDH